ncbi:hypothetical protein B9Z19DRAFT_1005929 [Tuber borchii]|uniref:Uncharacterized protein n=1 Tax=Tuber borchii TaxID=42251 RepID=A0A2T6ZCA2_TUBBO|nr:hypothetical protein B9Z19DRAFT_1005929 [Tuber borchii]
MLNRASVRNVHIYDANDPGIVLGGLVLTNGVTTANFYSMVEIVFLFNQGYTLRDENGITVGRDDHPLQPGKYFIVTAGSITVSDETWLVRAAVPATTYPEEFCHAVRERDRGCVMTGKGARRAAVGYWVGLEAAYVFPLAYEHHWIKHNYGDWITLEPESRRSINSVQNGLLLWRDLRIYFDSYMVSINPDDNYKIVCFMYDDNNIAGTHLDKAFVEDPKRPVDQVLRWHFRQAVLANMRGQGEPVFECDFPSGSYILDDIMSGPKAGERMEFELFTRLAGYSICN